MKDEVELKDPVILRNVEKPYNHVQYYKKNDSYIGIHSHSY